ncbi:MAG TPA: hypothetical protein VM688_07435, partial [Nocardioidaceae bacterium]|nr:hypothetical protein [Nocardioidaceae bacterium]
MTTSADTSRVKLDWSSNSESDLAGYLVYRSNTANGTYTKLTATPRTSSDYSDTAARAGFPSYYKVTAVDKTGNQSAPVAVTNTRKDGIKPVAVKSLTGVRTDNGIKLDWADNTEADLAGYVVTRATSSSGTYTKLTANPIKVSTFEDQTASAGGTYYYKVSAVDFSGYLSSAVKLAMLPPDVTAPKSVSGMTTSVSTSYVKLDWSSNSESDLAGYNVYRAATANGQYTKLTTSLRTSSDYTDYAAPVGVTSFYRVTAVDKSGNESGPVSVSAVRKDAVAPAAVKSLTGTRTDNGITLDWADNTETDLNGYVVSRATTSGGTYTKLTATPVKASTFTDATAAAGTAYYYKVTAVDVSGNSSSSASVAVLPPDVTAPKAVAGMAVSADTSRVKLDWTSNTESDLAGYVVYRSATVDGTYSRLTATPTTSSDYSDTAAPVGVTSFYR